MIENKNIELLNYKWNKNVMECEDNNDLLNKLHKSYKIDKDILYILLELDLFHLISNIKVVIKNGIFTYTLPENPKLYKNYQKYFSYIFATYLIYNKNLTIKNKKRGYCLLNNDNIIKKNSELNSTLFNSYINFNLQLDTDGNAENDEDIYLNIQFNEIDVIAYDVNLLNLKEKEDLNKSINKQKEKYIHSIDNIMYFKFKLKIDNNLSLIEIHNKINLQCEEYYNYYISLLKKFKEYNKVFFERALLEEQIKNF